MPSDLPVLKKGSFYLIRDGGTDLVLEDRTKRGLAVRGTFTDEALDARVDKGMIHDMDGIGHWVAVRWFFPKDRFGLGHVLQHAEAMEKKYTKLRELTCPD